MLMNSARKILNESTLSLHADIILHIYFSQVSSQREEPVYSLLTLFSPNTLFTGVSGADVSCPPAHMVASSSPSNRLQADKAALPNASDRLAVVSWQPI